MSSKYTKEILQDLVVESKSVADVIRKLNLSISGGNHSYIRKRIDFYEISTEHFTGQASMKGVIPKNKRTLQEFISEVLCSDGVYTNSHSLKLKLYEFGLKEECCELCGLGNTWNGNKISLHLDHINGVNTDNDLNNLRILCPNCHSQTSTYAGKRNKSKVTKEEKLEKIDNHCSDCNCLIGREASRCKSCKASKQAEENRTYELPNKELLSTMLFETNFTQVAKKYNVSDNSVRKWCTKYGMSTKASDYL